MNTRFVPFVTTPKTLQDPALWYLFQAGNLLIAKREDAAPLPLATAAADLDLAVTAVNYLGFLEGDPRRHCFTAEIAAEQPIPADWELRNLRTVYGRLPDDLFWVAARAVQVLAWDRTHQFCSRCATPLELETHERVKKCPACGLSFYPRLSPAIIVRVTKTDPDGEKILLAHNNRFPRHFYSVLAGFVEPGETLEDCVRREIWEEVGIEVEDIRYFGSQPWPFPNSLMIAFTAVYGRGTITVDEVEIGHADWFTPDTLPHIPPKLSIARQLIDDYVAMQQKQTAD